MGEIFSLGFYDDEKTALQYVEMAEGYDGRELIEVLTQFFLDRYRDVYPDSDLIQLDAVTLATERIFNCVYSNKVLHHLTDEQLKKSLRRQQQILSDEGLVMHSFWRGTGVDEHHGLRFVYQTEDSIRAIVGDVFKVLDTVVYKEMEDGDSLYVIATV